MKMKEILRRLGLGTSLVLFLAVPCVTALADPEIPPFKGWKDIIENSPDIFVARRTDPVQLFPTNGIMIVHETGSCSIEIVSVLKGAAKMGPAELWLPNDAREGLLPRRGDIFLAFASRLGSAGTNSSYVAIENYRTVVIAPEMYYQVWTNELAGKTLNEQIMKILQYRRDELKEELERDEAEHKRIEQGLQELKN